MTWKLLQERTPAEGAFAAIDELLVTTGALALLGKTEMERALGVLVTAAIIQKLDTFQVLERGDGECVYAVDEDCRVTLMLPKDW